jgi:hypothetical protein
MGQCRLRYSALSHSTPQYSPSGPLDRAGRLRDDVVDDAVDAAALVNDARRGHGPPFLREGTRRPNVAFCCGRLRNISVRSRRRAAQSRPSRNRPSQSNGPSDALSVSGSRPRHSCDRDRRSFAEPTAAQGSSTRRSRSSFTSLHLRALSEGESVLHVDAQIAYGALDLRVAEQDVHSAQVPCLLIDDGRLGSAQRMGPVVFRA